MRTSLRPLLCALSLLAAPILPSIAHADPPRPGARRTAPLRARPIARPVAQPPVAVQVLGVRPGGERPWGAVTHAIQRDVSSWLYSCYTASGAPHAVAQVELDVSPQGRVRAARVVLGARRGPELAQCVERAARQLVLPPSDAEVPAENDTVSFEVRFGLPRNLVR